MSNENQNEKKEFLRDDGQLRVFVVPVDIMDVPGLDIYEQMVYMVLRSYVNPTEPTAFPSYKTIAERGRMSRRKAIDAMQGLVDKGLIQKEARLTVTKNRQIRNTSNLYTVMTPKATPKQASGEKTNKTKGSAQRAPGVVHDMHQGGAQRAPYHYHLKEPYINKIDCLRDDAAKIAASPSDEEFNHSIYETLKTEIPKNCFYKGLPLSDQDINHIYLMLVNQFTNRLSPEVIRIAAGIYFDRACCYDLTTPNGVSMKLDITSPTGFFQNCYTDALKQYKATTRNKKKLESR